MNISYNWLKKFIDLPLSPEDTAEKLTLIGLEVDEIKSFGSSLDGVLVGEILEVKKHANADRLRLCQVNLGSKKVQIVCGANNVASGQKVPVATVGALLPPPDGKIEPLKIKKVTLRGEPSEGVICAEDELGLGEDHSGIMVLDDDCKPGSPLKEALELCLDTIFDIEITPNRPDAASHLGVARDLAAALNLELKKPFKTDFEKQPPLNNFDIEIENPEKCHRYVGKIVENVSIGESPRWLKNKLKALEIRPVNNVVDVTNYVMIEMGQPLHAFDKQKLKDQKIVVKDFNEKIAFETLDHVKRTCPAGTLFICDGREPVAIAGLMGGVNSEVGAQTSHIIIESAYFAPPAIRKSAKEQALQTDASYRFERGVDPKLQRIAAERAAQLISQTAGGNILNGCSDIHAVKFEAKKIKLRKNYTNRLLGAEFKMNEIIDLLDGLELAIDKQDEDSVSYIIPSFRPDLKREVDLIEEVGRLFDYNNIPAPKHGSFTSAEQLTDWEQLNSRIKETAKQLQFREIYANSLISEEDAARLGETHSLLHTLNPNSADMTTLRPTLLHGFLQSAAYNFNRGASGVRFFETGHVFSKSTNGTYFDGIHEEVKILFGLTGLKNVEHWNTEPENYAIFDLKAVINSFFNSLKINKFISTEISGNNQLDYYIKDTQIGTLLEVERPLREFFEIESSVYAAEFSISKIYKLKQELPEITYEPVSKFPAFDFDFGVIVDSHIPVAELLESIRQTAGNLLNNVDVFDVFEGETLGEHKKNIAFRLSFLDKNKTLTINDVEPIIEKILRVLDDKFSAKLRNS